MDYAKEHREFNRTDQWIPRAVVTEKRLSDARARKRFLYFGIAAGVIVHLLGLVLFKVEPVPETPILIDRPYLSLTSQEFGELSLASFDQIALIDSAPLFLPSQWNTNSGNLDTIRSRRPADLFLLYPPELSFEDSPAAAELSLNLESIVDSRVSLVARNRFPFASFGRYDRQRLGLPDRFAQVAVYPYAGGAAVRHFEIAAESVPESIRTELYSETPVVLSVQTSPAGSLGPVLLIDGTGEAEVDQFLRARITEFLRESGGLESGYYRIEVGP